MGLHHDGTHRPSDPNEGVPPLRAAFASVPLGLASWHAPELSLVSANAPYRALIGREDVVGRPARELLAAPHQAQLLDILERTYATGDSGAIRELRLRMPGGGDETEEFVDVFIDAAASPLVGDRGEVIGVVAQVSDVTARVAERRQRERGRPAERAHTRDVVVEVQDALLPPGLAVLPCVDLAGRYLLGGDARSGGGGDWFDSVPLSGGRVALVVGDVVGHGVPAVAVMGQLRAVLHAALRSGEDPVEALAALDDYARGVPGAHAATAVVAVLDPARARLDYVTAGHPPPLVVPRRGDGYFLAGSGGGPLTSGVRRALASHELGPDDVVLLYSDGLVEQPGRALTSATVELCKVATEAVQARDGAPDPTVPAAERVCRDLLDKLTRVTGHVDDVAVLAAQVLASPVAPLRLEFPADVEAARSARRALATWFERLRLSGIDAMALQHAVGELVANAARHAYAAGPGSGGSVRVSATLGDDGRVVVEVADDGRWRETASGEQRGRGLSMATGFVDALSVVTGETGTTARVAHAVVRAAQLFTTPATGRPRPGPGHEGFGVDRDQGVLHLRGAVDDISSVALGAELRDAGRGGTQPVEVDLSDVEVLASPGVQVLADALQAAVGGAALSLFAAMGTPAQHVLDLVDLPYRSERPQRQVWPGVDRP